MYPVYKVAKLLGDQSFYNGLLRNYTAAPNLITEAHVHYKCM